MLRAMLGRRARVYRASAPPVTETCSRQRAWVDVRAAAARLACPCQSLSQTHRGRAEFQIDSAIRQRGSANHVYATGARRNQSSTHLRATVDVCAWRSCFRGMPRMTAGLHLGTAHSSESIGYVERRDSWQGGPAYTVRPRNMSRDVLASTFWVVVQAAAARGACPARLSDASVRRLRENRSGLSSRPPRHWLVDASLNTVAHGFSGIRADSIRACPCDCARHACTALVTAHPALLGMRENRSGLSSSPPRH